MNSQEVLAITPRDVAALLTMDDCIVAVENAFRQHGEGKALPPGVLSMHVPGGGFHVKAGVLDLGRQYFAAKVNGNFPGNGAQFGLPTIQGMVVLCDAEKGTPLAVMDSREITALRTAAATAVAARHLARADSRILTICGCGTQGYMQVKAVTRVCALEKVLAYDLDPTASARLASRAAGEFHIAAAPAHDLVAAVLQSDICITCTTSQKPLLGSNDVRRGTFIAAVGADNPAKQEIAPDLMRRSKIVVDIVEQCAVMGDLHHALEAGVVTRTDVHAELGEIVAGKKRGRESSDEIIVFDSTGMALQDVAAAAAVYEKALRQGTGVRLDFAA